MPARVDGSRLYRPRQRVLERIQAGRCRSRNWRNTFARRCQRRPREGFHGCAGAGFQFGPGSAGTTVGWPLADVVQGTIWLGSSPSPHPAVEQAEPIEQSETDKSCFHSSEPGIGQAGG
jgi:hypothetical protein